MAVAIGFAIVRTSNEVSLSAMPLIVKWRRMLRTSAKLVHWCQAGEMDGGVRECRNVGHLGEGRRRRSTLRYDSHTDVDDQDGRFDTN